MKNELLPIAAHPCQELYGVNGFVIYRGRVAHCIKKLHVLPLCCPKNGLDYSSQRARRHRKDGERSLQRHTGQVPVANLAETCAPEQWRCRKRAAQTMHGLARTSRLQVKNGNASLPLIYALLFCLRRCDTQRGGPTWRLWQNIVTERASTVTTASSDVWVKLRWLVVTEHSSTST